MSEEDFQVLRNEEHIRAQFECEELDGDYADPHFNLVNVFETPEKFIGDGGNTLATILTKDRSCVTGP